MDSQRQMNGTEESLRMIKKLSMTIPLKPITKKNSQRIATRKINGKYVPFILQSKAYVQYEKDCGYFIKGRGMRINQPVNVKCVYYMPTRRRVDLTNLMEATHDILVKYEVLEDDNFRIIQSVDGSRVEYDKDNPRTEIEITVL